jgi:adenosine deaminase
LVHTEIFFDPQTHTGRGISFDTVIQGIHSALEDAKEKLGISSQLIMCFLRHLDEVAAFDTLEQALPYKEWIAGVGLDSSEMGHPPSKFENVFLKALDEGFITVAHAGEEGPAAYVWEAINLLKISRIDHGNRSLEDDQLIKHIAEKQIPLTVCPLSNLALKVVEDLKDHPLLQLMEAGLMVTINSDDPAYFGGYMNENFIQIAAALNLSKKQIAELAKNSFKASFLSDVVEKEALINQVEDYYQNN